MIFHNSTTIRHNFSPSEFSLKENRLAYGVLGRLQDIAVSSKNQAIKGGGYLKKASLWGPVKYLFPLSYVYKYTAKGAIAGYKKAIWAGHTAYEGAKGIVDKKDSIGRGFFDLATTPITALRRLFIGYKRNGEEFAGNFRSLIAGVFRTPYELGAMAGSGALNITKKLFSTPYNLIRHPLGSVIGMKNGVVKAVTNVRNRTAHVLDDVMHLHIGKLAKETRDNVVDALKAPFKALAKPWEAITRTPKEIGKNYKNAGMAYPEGVGHWIDGIRSGVSRILNATDAATAKLSNTAQPAAAAAH